MEFTNQHAILEPMTTLHMAQKEFLKKKNRKQPLGHQLKISIKAHIYSSPNPIVSTMTSSDIRGIFLL